MYCIYAIIRESLFLFKDIYNLISIMTCNGVLANHKDRNIILGCSFGKQLHNFVHQTPLEEEGE